MKIINSHNVYSLILNELEWYAGTDQQRDAWANQCSREAEENKCRYATIMVEPEAVMSISPNPKRHKVWYKTFPTSLEQSLRADLEVVLRGHLKIVGKARTSAIFREYSDRLK